MTVLSVYLGGALGIVTLSLINWVGKPHTRTSDDFWATVGLALSWPVAAMLAFVAGLMVLVKGEL